jgi:hypothetical protein
MTRIAKQTTAFEVRQFGWWRLAAMAVFVNMSACSDLHVATSQDFNMDDIKAGDAILAASLLDGLLQNNLAISSFDVTYDAEYMVHKPDNRLTASHLKVRYCKNEVDQGLFVRSRISSIQIKSCIVQIHFRLSIWIRHRTLLVSTQQVNRFLSIKI